MNCKHFGDLTGGTVNCPSCAGRRSLKLFRCDVYGACTPSMKVDYVACCNSCPSYVPKESAVPKNRWTYGVTTVPERADLFRKTVRSLAASGFDVPMVFMDNPPKLGAYGRWILALAELYIREPMCNRYVVFQDDVQAAEGLCEYLDTQSIPPKHYWNLITYPQNAALAAKHGWFVSDQRGRGAQGYVFTRDALQVLFMCQSIIARPTDLMRGKVGIDASVAVAMRHAGWKELCHSPSLLDHIGVESTIGSGPQPKVTFTGRCK